ncbi:unnamed protein product [Blumeria hordei]|uniref:Mitochondrial division protein 1 n=2 Tax=Blumeria hordei TaxID=2867405 RepID=A0A383USU4_BLUHO|nr:Mitochondrial division protein 1 [Blumeria hordei DH14]SZF03433.1 unnamed protein product [Blumeria hordei]
MAGFSSHNDSPIEEESALISTKGIEAFGKKFTTTAGHLIGDPISSAHYQNAMNDLHMQLRRPNIQRSIFSLVKTSPTDLVRSQLSKSEIQYRALTYVPDELLKNIPENDNKFSLFQGFQATVPENFSKVKRHHRKISRGRQLRDNDETDPTSHTTLSKFKKEKRSLDHQLEMIRIRKNLASCEIREIDNKISNLLNVRKILLDRSIGLENEEALLEQDILDSKSRLEEAENLIDDNDQLSEPSKVGSTEDVDEEAYEATFMSESIYDKLPSSNITASKINKQKASHRKLIPIPHENMTPGTMIREFRAHPDAITTLDFDAPFGTMVTAALDDTVRVWDLNTSRCIGLLEGHTASVRTLQVEENIVATGSVDATIRLWDLKKAYCEPTSNRINKDSNKNITSVSETGENEETMPLIGTMRNCPIFSLEAHVDEVTALHFRGDTLISGSADKTLRQWDLEKGRCVQTLDVMWAAAQASTSLGSGEGSWRQTGKFVSSSADFVGALQVFDAALACGTADGMVRLWDLRSGQVHRSLVGHTGPVTALQFDDVHLVTGSLDRSVRIWDLRAGAIYDAYAYNSPITSMMFDHMRIAAAAGEDVVKIYDKMEGRQWDCGPGTLAVEGTGPAIVEKVCIKEGFLVEGRQDGMIGLWTC